jgi:Uma2 family endonuclease
MNLSVTIGAHLRAHPVGRIFAAPFDVILSEFDVVEPDLIYLSNRRLAEIETSPWVRGAPDLVVEIGSPGTRKRDATTKRRLYERFGVSEYWLVDPDLDTVQVYRLADGRYARITELTVEHGDVLTTPLLPGLELPLSSVFED